MLYRRVIFGVLEKEALKSMLDLSPREMVILFPLIVLTIFFGFYPAPILDAIGPSVEALVHQYTQSLGAMNTLSVAAH